MRSNTITTKQCLRCGENFNSYSSQKRRYCSRGCVAGKKEKVDCPVCFKKFSPTSHGKKYCSPECYRTHRFGNMKWVSCPVCLATIGLGSKVAARVLGKKPSRISSIWKNRGIASQTPECGSWTIYAQQAGKPSEEEKLYEKTRMEDIKQAHSKGFTWAYLWAKDRASRASMDKYNAMTDDEKKVRNRKTYENRLKRFKADPESRDAHRKAAREWKKRNPTKARASISASIKKRKKTDPGFRVQCNLRSRLKDLMKTARRGGAMSSSGLIGCTTKELSEHLESMFTKRMTWDNYGTYWHVDHILPCASFDHTDDNQVKRCWHYTNLQPLEAKKNMEKSDKITRPQMKLTLEYV